MNSQINRLIRQAVLDTISFHAGPQRSLELHNHMNSSCTMLYLKSGQMQYYLNDQIYNSSPGTVILAPAGHDFTAASSSNEISFLFLWTFRYQVHNVLDVFSPVAHQQVFSIEHPSEFEEQLKQYYVLFQKERTLAEEITLQAKGLELISVLFSYMLKQPAPSIPHGEIPEVFCKILFQIMEHPEIRISLKELSHQYHMHPTYISNRFKHHFGLTPSRLQRNVLVNQAKAFLQNPNITITEISARLGFGDISSFTQFFSDLTGESPSQYRRNVLNETAKHKKPPL